jgi:hypothetical protein
MTHARFRFAIGLLVFSVAILYTSRVSANGRGPAARPRPPLDARGIQRLVDTYRVRLAIPQRVTVTLVERNPLMASVEFDKARKGAFLLSLERGFAASLTPEELLAVIAHELGHVWIFTHHPYLQTESLANKVAMRVVKRERLEQVYLKVWQHGGEKGTLARFMGPRPTEPATSAGLNTIEPIKVPPAPKP